MTVGDADPAPRQRRHTRFHDVLKDVVLGVAALLGVLCIAWLVYAQQTGSTVIILKTGSMSPTIPQGSGAISKPVPAGELVAGDIVTVRLDDASPLVTHRVKTVEPITGEPNRRRLTLQGDANDVPDQFPYQVSSALKVQMVLPHAGYGIQTLKQPIFLGGSIVVIGVLMLWAFWPPPLAEIEREMQARGKRR